MTVTAKLDTIAGHCESTSIEPFKDPSGSKNAVQAVGSSQTYNAYAAQAIPACFMAMTATMTARPPVRAKPSGRDQFFEIKNLIEECRADSCPCY